MKKSLLIVMCSLSIVCLGGWGSYKLANQNSEEKVETEMIDKVFSDNNSSNVLNLVITANKNTFVSLNTEIDVIKKSKETKEPKKTKKPKTTKRHKKIKKSKKTKKPKPLYTEEELNMLSHLIYGEAGCHSNEMQLGVGSVVLNRVKSKYYPNTIKEVIFQKGQYACTWDGNYNKKPDKQAISNAKYLLENGSQYPEYVVFQAEFKQGDGVYKKIENTYFCYYGKK